MSNIKRENKPPQKRMLPPGDFNEEQQRIWNNIVHTVVDWHLTPQHTQLVRRLVVVMWQLSMFERRENEIIEAEGIEGLFADDMRVAISKRTMALARECSQLHYSLRLEPTKQTGVQDEQKLNEDQMFEADAQGDNLLFSDKAH